MKVYTEGKNMQLELIRFLKNRDFIVNLQLLKWALFFPDRWAHCIRYESPLFGSEAPGSAGASGMTTSVTSSVRNVGQSANSALKFVTLDFVYNCLG